MTKRKRVDVVRWAWVDTDGVVQVACRSMTLPDANAARDLGETVIRVRVTEIVKAKKKRSKK